MSSVSAATLFQVKIDPAIIARFPETKVSFLLAKIMVEPKPTGAPKEYLDALKTRVVEETYKTGLRGANYQKHPVCQSWDRVFSTFNVDPAKKSTIHYLLGRVAKECDKRQAAEEAGKKPPKPDLGRISNFVDFYNGVSVLTQTPMGALDLAKIRGPIELRYGHEGEIFRPLGKTDEVIDVKPEHVVYADDASVLTWLWNHRDAKHACVPDRSEGPAHILLFADQADGEGGNVEAAIDMARRELHNIGGECLVVDTLSRAHPEGTYNFS